MVQGPCTGRVPRGCKGAPPEVQSELRLEEEPPVVRSAVDLGTWGDR